MQNKWTADISEISQCHGAPAQIVLAQLQSFIKSQQNVTSAGMPNPCVNRYTLRIRSADHSIQQTTGCGSGQRWHFRRENVPQHAVALFKSQEITRSGIQLGPEPLPLDAAGLC